MESKLYSVEEVTGFIKKNKVMALAGDERVLSQLPKGNWIGGTIPYFMNNDKGQFNQDQIFVNEFSDFVEFKIAKYTEGNILNVVKDSYANGFSVLIIPPFQKIHETFSLQAVDLDGLFENPLVGWVAGKNLNAADDVPKIYNGATGESYTEDGIALHVKLSTDKSARLEIVNIFKKNAKGDSISFQENTFQVSSCLVNGVEQNFAQYIADRKIDTKLPIVADYSGAMINVSIKELNDLNNTVSFFAPVFKGVEYKFAEPINDYPKEFNQNLPSVTTPVMFSCNCVLNYLYGGLEGERTEGYTGPATFGEIGYQLLNQTLTFLVIE